MNSDFYALLEQLNQGEKMNREEFRERLAERPFLFDGAMGTLLHSRGIAVESLDAVNVHNPAIVAEVHRAYIDAGADIIETNTFGANRYKLAEHGLQDEVVAVNQAAVNIAKKVIEGTFKGTLLAGSVGPLGVRLAPLGRVSVAEARVAFAEQIQVLIDNGVDFIVFETMSDLYEVKAAVKAARKISTDIPLVAQMTFTRDDRTLLGDTPSKVAHQLAKLDLDAIGVNCSGGPSQVLRIISTIRKAAPEMILSAMPNAGWPEQTVQGRVMYPATPEYFGKYTVGLTEAGVRLVGGCCGTTDAHIAAMRHALDTPGHESVKLPIVRVVEQEETVHTAVIESPTRLKQYFDSGTFVITAEMRPPRGVSTNKLLHAAFTLKDAGANMLNIADTPVAQMRMSAWAAARVVQKEVGLETILHFPTRGRNLLRIQGDLLATYALGLRNLFVTMGDPTRIGDYPEAMDTYDIVPTGLIQLIKQQFNSGVDKAGRTIDQPTNFMVGCALSLTPRDIEREMKLLRKKINNGADFALTQPVFDAQKAKAFVDLYEQKYEEPMIPIIAGMYPLYNGRNAEFLHNEVPGMEIPEEQRQRMHNAQNSKAEGVQIAKEILTEIRPFIQGVYMMPAFSRYDLAAEVLDILPSL